MKKINNKYRNGNLGNSQYSLNYKFDSISVAGKVSGTALELIKKYNELAKEAHSNGNYTEMENFRQYAEHYRKIVTDINERKNTAPRAAVSNPNPEAEEKAEEQQESVESNEKQEAITETKQEAAEETKEKVSAAKKSFKVVEVTPQEKTEVKKVARKRITRKKDEASEA